MEYYDCLIVGSGPAGLGTAFRLKEGEPGLSILIIEKGKSSSGGLRNDCKMNFTYPVGFPLDVWDRESADRYLTQVEEHLKPDIMHKNNLGVYAKRAEKLAVSLLDVRQAHLGTDGGIRLIKRLSTELKEKGVDFSFGEEMVDIDSSGSKVLTNKRSVGCKQLFLAPGRSGFRFLQKMMEKLAIPYMDHIVDIGIRIETTENRYSIVRDYYDPKFIFPEKVRTFCTNSKSAYVVREKYSSDSSKTYYSVNGHAFSKKAKENGMCNFALLKTVRLTEPLASGQEYAEMLGLEAMLLGGGKPIMQRIGDFRLGKRSKEENFTGDLYDFKPTMADACPGDISLAMPARILRAIWKSLKLLDTIVPGVMHPSTVMYYPEIKLYANKPTFLDRYFQVKEGIYMLGDGAGTSRGITAAWASGIRAAEGALSQTGA